MGEADDGANAVAAAQTHRPDVVLMDIRMPVMDGIAATEALRRLARPPHVIVLTTFQADEHVDGALRAGADWFLLKDTAPTEIVSAVRLVAAGEAMLSPRRSPAHLLSRPRQQRHDRSPSLRCPTPQPPPTGSGKSLLRWCLVHPTPRLPHLFFMQARPPSAYVSRLLTELAVTNRVHIANSVHDAQS